ncbi:ATP-binding protein [Flavobacterium sp. XGLA_31]|uniref:ATP-binding protein n=1 Tax=Flavobacterium sp. XGLA_31 TaxID=3447666 RepID=UPI003F31166F
MRNTISLPQINYQAIFNNVPGLYLVLQPDYTIVEVSAAYAEATLVKRENVIGRNLFDVFPDNPGDKTADGVANLRNSLDFVVRNKESHTMPVQKYDIRKPNGKFEERFWSPLNKPVFDAENNIQYIIHRAVDVTDFVNLEKDKAQKEILSNQLESRVKEMNIEIIKRSKEIEQLNKELDLKVIERTKHLNEANKTIQKNIITLTTQKKQLEDFCNIISHNLRAPLLNISMLIEMLSDNTNNLEKEVLLEKLNSTTKNLSAIFNELVESLQIYQDHEIPSEKLDLETYVLKTTETLQAEIDKSEAVIETQFDAAPFVCFPVAYLKSILHNLISNSLKYQSPDRKPHIKIASENHGDSIVLSITDNGLGIDLEKHLENMFKIRKVFHNHPDAKGFGLYLTKSQVEAMGGKIWVESTPNEGTTFYVELIKQAI